MFDRTALRMLIVGGSISILAFGFSLFSAAKINLPPEYKKSIFSGKIENVSDIEDLEYAKGCKFWFYDKTGSSSNLVISSAREFRIEENKRPKMFEEVKKWKDSCTEGRIIYISEASA